MDAEAIELNLQCRHCHRRYSNNSGGRRVPKVIPCGHTFCGECLQSKATFSCPTCGQEYDPGKATTNHALIGVVIVTNNMYEAAAAEKPKDVIAEHVSKAGRKLLDAAGCTSVDNNDAEDSGLARRQSRSSAKYREAGSRSVDCEEDESAEKQASKPGKKVRIKLDRSPQPTGEISPEPLSRRNSSVPACTCAGCGATGGKNEDAYSFCVDCGMILCPVCAEDKDSQGVVHQQHQVYPKFAAADSRKRRLNAESELIRSAEEALDTLHLAVQKAAPEELPDIEALSRNVSAPLRKAIKRQEKYDWTQEVKVFKLLNAGSSDLWQGMRQLNKHVRTIPQLSDHLQEYWEKLHQTMRVYAADRMSSTDRVGPTGSYACSVM